MKQKTYEVNVVHKITFYYTVQATSKDEAFRTAIEKDNEDKQTDDFVRCEIKCIKR